MVQVSSQKSSASFAHGGRPLPTLPDRSLGIEKGLTQPPPLPPHPCFRECHRHVVELRPEERILAPRFRGGCLVRLRFRFGFRRTQAFGTHNRPAKKGQRD